MTDDTDHPTHDVPDDDLQLQDVAAVVDGTATPDERARVEASPQLSALAGAWRDEQDVLRTPVVAPAGARDAALAAAMAAFDELHAASGGPGAADAPIVAPQATGGDAKVLQFERRRRSMRILTGAAAAVAVLFVGGLAVGGRLGGTSDDATTAEAPTSKVAATDGASDAASGAAGAMTAEADAAPSGASAESVASPFMADDTTGGDSTGDDSSGGGVDGAIESTEATLAAGASEATTAPAPGGITGPAEIVVSVTSPEQLADFARSRSAQLPLPGLDFPCVGPGLEALGVAEYQGIQVIVVRDPATDEIRAVELATCDVLASVTP